MVRRGPLASTLGRSSVIVTARPRASLVSASRLPAGRELHTRAREGLDHVRVERAVLLPQLGQLLPQRAKVGGLALDALNQAQPLDEADGLRGAGVGEDRVQREA